ncbi:MAG: FAD-dependent oxidoreductase [Gemmatimonadota bacterium]
MSDSELDPMTGDLQQRRIAVIGGGLAGLTAAYRLVESGAAVVLFEGREGVGGRMVTDRLDGCSIDAGAQLFGSMYRGFLGLAREIGLEDHLVPATGRDALWRNGRAHEVVYGSVTSMIASGGLPLSTKMRLGAKYVPFLARHAEALDLHAPERAAAAGLDEETIAEWGEREIGKAFVSALVYPQLGAYYGSLPQETSAGLYHILARDAMDVSLYAVRGGAGVVSDRLASLVSAAGGEVRTASQVREVVLEPDRVRIATDGGAEQFDAAVSAVPAPALLDVAAELPHALREWAGAVRYRPALSLALLLDEPLGVRYFGLSFPQGETRFTAAICVQEAKQADLVPAGRGLLVAFPTPESTPGLIDADSRQVLERMLPEIARAFPGVEDRVTRARVYRWPLGSPVFVPGYLRHLAAVRGDQLLGDAPFALAGDYLYGPSVEGAVHSGALAADRLLRRYA